MTRKQRRERVEEQRQMARDIYPKAKPMNPPKGWAEYFAKKPTVTFLARPPERSK